MHRTLTLFYVLGHFSLVEGQTNSRVQDHNAHGWYIYVGDHPIKNTRWGIHLEGLWRRHAVITRWQQWMFRPAVNFNVTPNFQVSAGAAYIDTFRYGDFPVNTRFPEYRIYQQALLKHGSGKPAFEHRYRLEQRYLGETSRDADGERRLNRWRYENRFRYQFRMNVPLNRPKVEQGAWYLGTSNELMIAFGKNVASNIFDQNRAFGGIGYGLTKNNRVEFGYMNQLIQQRNGRIFEYNHTLIVGWYSSTPFGRRD